MKAYWLDDHTTISVDELEQNRIFAEQVGSANFQSTIDRIKKHSGYITHDIVEITPTTPNLETLLQKFDQEHNHTDDEVRLVLEGGGSFDIRSNDDRWIRIEVAQGDYLCIPAHRYHRFFCTNEKFIRCVRVFKDPSGWTAFYRQEELAST